MIHDPLMECRRCGLVDSQTSELCQPVLLLEPCLDHSIERPPYPPAACEHLRADAAYLCALCARPSVEALNVCYPRRRGAAPSPGRGG